MEQDEVYHHAMDAAGNKIKNLKRGAGKDGRPLANAARNQRQAIQSEQVGALCTSFKGNMYDVLIKRFVGVSQEHAPHFVENTNLDTLGKVCRVKCRQRVHLQWNLIVLLPLTESSIFCGRLFVQIAPNLRAGPRLIGCLR